MTALAERAVDLPTDRYGLFDEYYSVVYDRELQKGEGFRDLRVLRPHIDHLHENAALVLHRRSENPSNSSSISHHEVSKLLRRRLVKAGFEEHEAEERTAHLLQLSTERLVMLVSRRARKYEFEVRSLQEYMAARALTDGQDEEVIERLRLVLPSAHWRNTWLLAAGRLLRSREHLLDQLVGLVVEYDKRDPEAEMVAAGAFLAADLFVDHFGEEFPKVRRALLERATSLLSEPMLSVPLALRDLVHTAIDDSSGLSSYMLQRLDAASQEANSGLAALILTESSRGASPLAQLARSLARGGRALARPETRSTGARAFILGEHLGRVADSGSSVEALATVLVDWGARPESWDDALEEPEVRAALLRAVSRLRQRAADVSAFGIELIRVRAAKIAKTDALTISGT